MGARSRARQRLHAPSSRPTLRPELRAGRALSAPMPRRSGSPVVGDTPAARQGPAAYSQLSRWGLQSPTYPGRGSTARTDSGLAGRGVGVRSHQIPSPFGRVSQTHPMRAESAESARRCECPSAPEAPDLEAPAPCPEQGTQPSAEAYCDGQWESSGLDPETSFIAKCGRTPPGPREEHAALSNLAVAEAVEAMRAPLDVLAIADCAPRRYNKPMPVVREDVVNGDAEGVVDKCPATEHVLHHRPLPSVGTSDCTAPRDMPDDIVGEDGFQPGVIASGTSVVLLSEQALVRVHATIMLGRRPVPQ